MRRVLGVRLFMQALIMVALLPLGHSAFAGKSEDGYRLLELDGYKVKWGEPKFGVGASISYAFADQPLKFDGARNCRELAPMSALSKPDIPFETLVLEAKEAFRVWERAADLSFHLVANVNDADIILGAQGKPRMQAFANVSHGLEVENGIQSIEQALVCLNPEHNWKVGFNGDNKVNDIRYTLIHEIGHAIGLDHPGPSGQVMGFRYTESFADLQPGDLRGVQLLYGKVPTISTE